MPVKKAKKIKGPTQAETIRALRRPMPKAGKIIDTNKKAYRRRQVKREAKLALEDEA